MADEIENGAAAAATEQEVPNLTVLAQYVKDLSFENPSAPASLIQGDGVPEIKLGVNVGARPLKDNDYEITLNLEAKANKNDGVLFNVELEYGGVFRITGVPEQNVHPIALIECPRLLFPFARQIIADVVRNGGFPPLMVDPVDFAALYRQRIAETQAAKAAEGEKPAN